jgi:hypothetical protein
VEVRENLVVDQSQAIADSELVFREAHARLRVGSIPSDGELRAADFLPMEEATDRVDGLELVIKIRFKMEFHGRCFSRKVDSDVLE